MSVADDISVQFLQCMRNRMLVSRAKYGPAAEAYPHKVDAIRSMMDRVREYERTGNTEFLVDAANFLMIEFQYPSIPSANFRATDDRESPGRRLTDGQKSRKDNAHV